MHTIKQLKTRKGNKDQRPQSSLKIRLASLSFTVIGQAAHSTTISKKE
jgi:hypothetical protein